jgi:predicted secreted protein
VVGRGEDSSRVDPVGPPLGGAPVTVRENLQEQRDKSAIVYIQSILILACIKRNIFRTLIIAALILGYFFRIIR